MSQMPIPGTPGGPMLPGELILEDLEIPGDFGTLIRTNPGKESCAECRSRQDPHIRHIADPCMHACSGRSPIYNPDLELSPGSSMSTPEGTISAATLLEEFIRGIM